jgi:D-3-phosphoglycerate dehydrogenase
MPGDPIARSVLKGFLQAMGQDVNTVNVRSLASALGLLVEEVKSNEETDFNEWLHVAAYSDGQKVSVGGTFFGARNHPRIVRINSVPVEVTPAGILFLMVNKDRPGIVGYLGTLMSKYDINIANMSLCRDNKGGHALTVLNLDTLPPAELLAEVRKDPDITNVHLVQL